MFYHRAFVHVPNLQDFRDMKENLFQKEEPLHQNLFFHDPIFFRLFVLALYHLLNLLLAVHLFLLHSYFAKFDLQIYYSIIITNKESLSIDRTDEIII